MGLTVGVVGVGAFARSFIPLFITHPLVEEVALCDLDAARLSAAAREYGVTRTYPSLEALCRSDVAAVVIITQNWLHAPQAVQALRAGKHVYSAVPTGITLDEIASLVRAVEETGLIYMLGETSYYYPAVLYCRRRYAAGDFGAAVYAEAEYYHDWDHGLYDVMRRRGGARWRETAGSPPMHYPTHSTSQIISVTGARMTQVSGQGFVDHHDDGLYGQGANRWDNPYSNETALFRLSDGSSCRINEFRRIGHPEVVRMVLLGTEAGFEENAAGAVWVTKDRAATLRLDDLLAPHGVRTTHGHYAGLASVHPAERLPAAFAAQPSGHAGSHPFLVDDFVQACVGGTLPPTHVWAAARYAVPGLIAHESAPRDGELLPIPDFGDPPAQAPASR
ncbi:MAG: Gfo/Idh/MocA family oxidoreductase [Chloroflexota bacterium]